MSDDEHQHDVVMPGFRFHPTEEELIEFYLRRKIEGKRFNVEIVTFLDLYRYDPWELPAMAAIGEKEWFFYVPRDRKYRNGDRPNRVTTSGYWKATGADRTIKSENLRSIGLKKTLVFYTGKAPKGIRTGWMMNEYRLPQNETENLQKVEISLCRVYKRSGVGNYSSPIGYLPTKASSSSASSSNSEKINKNNFSTTNFQASMERSFQGIGGHTNSYLDEDEKMTKDSGSSTTDISLSTLGLSKHNSFPCHNAILAPINSLLDLQAGSSSLGSSNLVPINNYSADDLHRLSDFEQISIGHNPTYEIHQSQPSHFYDLQPQSQTINTVPGLVHTISPGRFWEWSSVADEGNKNYNSYFK